MTDSLRDSVTPYELGFPKEFYHIQRFFSGVCGAKLHGGHDLVIPTMGVGGAHTHICPKDVLYGCICVSDIRELSNKDGTPSDLAYHELAHVLNDFPEFVTIESCGDGDIHQLSTPPDKYLDPEWTHGPEWQRIMKGFGKNPTLWVTSTLS